MSSTSHAGGGFHPSDRDGSTPVTEWLVGFAGVDAADPDSALRHTVERCVAALGLARAAVWTLDGSDGSPRCRAAVPTADASPSADWLAALRDAPGGALRPYRPGHAAVALRSGGELLGGLVLERAGGAAWSDGEHLVAGAAGERVTAALERIERMRTMDRLRERERLLADIEEVAELGIWEWDTVADRITWSDQQLRLHGIDRSREPTHNEAFLQWVHPDDRTVVIRHCEELMRTGVPFAFPYRIVRPDGTVRWLQGRGSLLPDETGALTRMVGSSQDITDRREADEALRASEESYRTIFELASEALFVHDPSTGAVLDANRAACELHGVTLDDLKRFGIPGVSRNVPPYDSAMAGELVRKAAAGEPQRFEWLGVHSSGADVWVEVTLDRATILGAERVIASVRNITERKLAEKALQNAYEELEHRVDERTAELAAANRALATEIDEHRVAREELQRRTEELEAVFAALPDVYLRLDGQGIITDFRRGTEAQEYPTPDVFPQELVGIRPTEFMPGETGTLLATTLIDVVRTGRVACVEYPLPVGGEARFFETRLAPISDGSVITIIRDITARKRGEEALAQARDDAEQARAAAEEANRAKSEFLSRMSHELRTPLNSILGFGQVLEGDELAAHQLKSVQHILRGGRHLLRLINEVLEIARIESGRHAFSLEPVRVAAVVGEAIGMVRPLAAQWDVQLDEPLAPDGDLYVLADRQRVVQVLLNLLSNAIKYNVRGGRVHIRWAPCDDGSRVVLVVRDTGPGIPAERLPQLFVPFARLGAEQSQVEGTGLGLALSQRLTEAMGGKLSLEETGREGTAFAVELGTARSPLRRFEEGTATAPRLGVHPHGPATLLYIEDNLANLSLVETILQSRPRWQTLPALQGQLGIELAREHAPDLILLDLHLPDISGEEVLRRLRADPQTADIPVVLISADATHATVERLLTAGAAAFLTKPLDIHDFLRTVENLLPSIAVGT